MTVPTYKGVSSYPPLSTSRRGDRKATHTDASPLGHNPHQAHGHIADLVVVMQQRNMPLDSVRAFSFRVSALLH